MPLHNWLIKFMSFEKNKYILGVFIDLSEALYTVDHSILLRKLGLYGIIDRNYALIKRYLFNRWQYIQVDKIEKMNIVYWNAMYHRVFSWNYYFSHYMLMT